MVENEIFQSFELNNDDKNTLDSHYSKIRERQKLVF